MIVKRCGHESEWPHNTPLQIREREYLNRGVKFLADVMEEEEIDPANAAITFCIPGRDFCVVSGNHKWEFFIFDEDGELVGRCWRMPTYRWLWKAAAKRWDRIVVFVRNFAFQALTGRSYEQENALTQGVRCTSARCRKLNGPTARQCQSCGCPLM